MMEQGMLNTPRISMFPVQSPSPSRAMDEDRFPTLSSFPSISKLPAMSSMPLMSSFAMTTPRALLDSSPISSTSSESSEPRSPIQSMPPPPPRLLEPEKTKTKKKRRRDDDYDDDDERAAAIRQKRDQKKKADTAVKAERNEAKMIKKRDRQREIAAKLAKTALARTKLHDAFLKEFPSSTATESVKRESQEEEEEDKKERTETQEIERQLLRLQAQGSTLPQALTLKKQSQLLASLRKLDTKKYQALEESTRVRNERLTFVHQRLRHVEQPDFFTLPQVEIPFEAIDRSGLYRIRVLHMDSLDGSVNFNARGTVNKSGMLIQFVDYPANEKARFADRYFPSLAIVMRAMRFTSGNGWSNFYLLVKHQNPAFHLSFVRLKAFRRTRDEPYGKGFVRSKTNYLSEHEIARCMKLAIKTREDYFQFDLKHADEIKDIPHEKTLAAVPSYCEPLADSLPQERPLYLVYEPFSQPSSAASAAAATAAAADTLLFMTFSASSLVTPMPFLK